MKRPSFQFYPEDFLVDENVVLMSNREIGAYIKLLCHCWIEGSIPKELDKIARLCGEDSSAIAELWQNISKCFSSANSYPDRLQNPRLEKEKNKQDEFRKERAESGKKGAKSRWVKEKIAMAEPMAEPMAKPMAKPMAEPMANYGSPSPSPTPSPTPTLKKKRSRDIDPAGFVKKPSTDVENPLSANADGRAGGTSSAEREEEKTQTKDLLVKGEEVGRTESIPTELPPDSRLSEKPKKPTDPRIKQFIDSYHAKFLSVFGSPPKIEGAKDGKLVKGLLGTFDLPFLLGLLDSFFSVSDDWIEKTGYTIGVFSTQVNKLIVANAGRPKNSQIHEIDWDEWRQKEEERKNARRNLARGD